MEELELKVSKEEKKEVETIANDTKNITNEKIEESLNYDALTDEEKKAIDEFNSKINIDDATQILQFGAKAQSNISKFSDSVLDDVKTKDAGEVGNLLANLVGEIKSFDSAVISENSGFLEKIFNNAKKQLDKIIAKYSKIESNVDKIESELEKNKLQMLKDIALFDTMYEKNLEYFKELSLYIIAGEKKIEELKNVKLPELTKKQKKLKIKLIFKK